MWINLKSGYTFKKVYGHLDELAEISASLCKANGFSGAGIVDIDNTFGHVRWRTACEKVGINPIYGVALPVTSDLQRGERRYPFNYMSFIALNTEGLQEIYEMVKIAHDQFYYRPRVVYAQVNALSSDVVVLSGVAPDWSQIKREVLFELSPNTPLSQRNTPNPIACIDNYYPTPEDASIYEPFADDRSRESKTTDMHILSMEEWMVEFGNKDAINKLKEINDDAWVDLPEAPMVKYIGSDDIEAWCRLGAAKRGLDITQGEYKERYDYEMKLIKAKDYVDYFLVTADLIRYAKTKMAVGHARGSSAGSLVCYLMGITEVDPLEYDLYFERFIDINRFDLPDIDIDFQDDKRHLVLKYLEKKYGKDCVAQLGNVNTMKPKSAIAKFAQSFAIPIDETQELKDAIIERSGGDARSAFCMEDTFNDTHVGKAFIEKYPEMKAVGKIEQHPSHTGVHAAGILVCNEPITEYCGVNTRDKKQIAMIDKKDAEKINLLKIDALGLRTLSILASVCDQLGKPYGWLYDIPLDNQKAYDVFNHHRYSGIFQFEGPAIRGLAQKMEVENIEDISALGALGRPGPLMSGGANDYIKYRNGKDPEYLSKHKAVIDSTESTFGVVIYQEQMLSIGREYGQLSWEDVCQLRKAASKSLGDEFFGKYEDAFIEGAMEQGESEDDAKTVWKGICSMGCLSGDTILKNPFPNHATPKEITLKELYENNGYIRSGAPSDCMKKQQLYCMVGDVIKPARLIEVMKSGVKETHSIVLDSLSELRATRDHKFFTDKGWKRLGDIKVGDCVAEMGTRRVGTDNKPHKGTGSGAHNHDGEHLLYQKNRMILKECENFCSECLEGEYEETHHVDGDRSNNDLENLQPLCRKCHKKIHREKDGESCIPHKIGKQIIYSKVIYIGDPKKEMTYDISMPDPNNSFVANNMVVHNSWGFNKSHSVSYGLISYLCAYMKGNHPLEFTVACLNNSKDDNSAIKILRDSVEKEDIKYIFFDREHSEREWSVKNGILYGGHTSLPGIGPAKANKILKARREGRALTPALEKSVSEPSSIFQYLYPAREVYGDYYDDNDIQEISAVQTDGEFTILGKLIKKNLRDLNEAVLVAKRKGEHKEGETTWLNITLEDDTGDIMCKIGVKDYERIGRSIAEAGKEDKDWYAVRGKCMNGWSLIFVTDVFKITR